MTDMHRAWKCRAEINRAVSEPPMSAGGIIFRIAAMGICTLAMFGILFAVASI